MCQKLRWQLVYSAVRRVIWRIQCYGTLLLGLLFITPGASASNLPLSVEDALTIKSFANCSPIALSPDGAWVAYTVKDSSKQVVEADKRYEDFTRTGITSQAVGCTVWITNTKNGKSELMKASNSASCSPVWAPDGKSLTFISDRDGMARLWLWDAATHRVRRLANTIVRSFNPQVAQWTPDGQKIIANALPEGLSIEQAADMLGVSKNLKAWSKPNETTSPDPSGSTVSVYENAASAETTRGKENGITSGTTTSKDKIQTNSWIDLNRFRADVAVVDVRSGQTNYVVRQMRPAASWLSPDGKYLAYMHVKGVRESSRDLVFQLVAVKLGDNSSQILADNVQQAFGYSVSWSPDSKSIAYLNSCSNPDGDCYLVSVNNGKCTNLTAGKHPSFLAPYRAPLWNSKGNFVYLISAASSADAVWQASTSGAGLSEIGHVPQHAIREIVSETGGRSLWSPDDGRSLVLGVTDSQTRMAGFYKLDLKSGAACKCFEENACFGNDLFGIDSNTASKSLVYVKEDAGQPRDIWLTDENFENRHRLSTINPEFRDTALGASIVIEYSDKHGVPLHAALLLPANYEKGRRYPLVVRVYGGSMASNTANNFGLSTNGAATDNMQLLASRGFAVLRPDIPLHAGTPMVETATAVMPAIDRVIELGIADPDRLGIWGHSYGGYSTLAVLVQTPRFRAAVASSGVSDLVSNFGTVDEKGVSTQAGWCEGGQGRMLGTPWEFRNRYIQNSPIFFLDSVQTPLLLTHGTLDEAVPHQQSEEVFVGLRRLGKEVVYAKYGGEGHWPGSWSYGNELDYCNRVIEWFEHHLLK